MMIPDKNFKLKRSTKVAMALGAFKDAHARGEFKRAMIQAQLAEEAAHRAALKSKDDKSNSGRTRGAVAPE